MANDYELRFNADLSTDGPRLIGYAARFNSLSHDLGGFHEIIAPGAFTRTLKENGSNILALVEHDPNRILGRVSNGTLQLQEDAKGLRAIIDPADTSYARDILALVKRQDVVGMSFKFRVHAGGDSIDMNASPLPLRTLKSVELAEVSVVLNPAYPATSVSARSLDMARAHHAQQALRRLRLRLAAL